jgi:hypothetical protein
VKLLKSLRRKKIFSGAALMVVERDTWKVSGLSAAMPMMTPARTTSPATMVSAIRVNMRA